MRAMVYRGPGRVRIEEKDIPSIEHPNDAIVQVTCAAIRGSDLHLYHGMMPDLRVGHTFGHEFVGTVHQVGPSVQNLKVGDRVLVPFNICCGSCYFCARGLYSNCHNVNPNATAVGGIYGYSHTCGGYDGGQAEFVRVPFADVGPTIIPEWMEEEDAVMLTDACPTGYFGAQLGDIKEGDVVVVFGAGPVGLFAAKSAWLMGAGRVIVVDHIDYRLEFARQFAHVETINFTQVNDIVQWVKETTDFLGADVCIEAVGAEADGAFFQHVTSAKFKLQGGSPVALNWCIDSVRKGGNVGVVGAFGPLFSAVKFGDAMNKGLTIRMNQCPVKRQWPRLFEHVKNGVLKPSAIITHRLPLDEIAEGYHLMSNKLDGCIKPLCHPNRLTEVIVGYTRQKPNIAPPREELERTIPGWGVDLDPAVRPSFPKEQLQDTGAHWDFPERQPELTPRERSTEHKFLTPVFGTAQPLRGLSGAIRRYAYINYSEAQTAHWLLLMLGDRVDVLESRITTVMKGRPDNVIAETGVRAEFRNRGYRTRFGQHRADLIHQPIDLVLWAAPYVALAGGAYLIAQAFGGRRRRR